MVGVRREFGGEGVDLALFLISQIALAAEPDRDDPAAELASFKLPPGFEANLFASEKDGVVKPIQMRWDTRGRLWVIQSTTYPQLVPGEVPNDKVLILEDPERASALIRSAARHCNIGSQSKSVTDSTSLS